tara:strand:+ start:1087 stop:1614 length:528 start_codon:yes stop_codon:yes gene_type:complete
MANTNTNEHPPEHAATPAPIEQAATPAPSEQLLDEAIAVSNGGSCFKQSDYSEGTWDAIEHDAIPFDDVCTIFPKGTELSIVRDHLDTLTIHDDTKAEILARLAGEMFSEVTFAIACGGEVTFEDDLRSEEWEEHCQDDVKVFRPGATHSEVADYLDALGINGDHRGHILEMIFC